MLAFRALGFWVLAFRASGALGWSVYGLIGFAGNLKPQQGPGCLSIRRPRLCLRLLLDPPMYFVFLGLLQIWIAVLSSSGVV